MSKKSTGSMPGINPMAMANLNRMTFLMSISEITPQIFISGQMAATLEQVQKLGITYILNVAIESSAIVYPKNVKLEKFDIIDFPTAPISNYFNTLTDKIHAHLAANKQNKVLVHCMAGISRSTTIVCAYLMRFMNMNLREAYLLCKKHRPICFPNLGFWNQLMAYEYQLKKENSVKMIPTQFGNVPDVAFEEIKQMRNQQLQQQQQQPASLPFFAPTFASTIGSSNNANSNGETLFSSPSTQTRPSARDMPANNSTGSNRSRSLAPVSNSRLSSVAAASTNLSNPNYQTPLFSSSKQTFLTPTRFGIGRLVPGTSTSTNLPSTTTNGSSSNNRNFPPSMRIRNTNNNQQSTNPTASSTNADPQRTHYETTYRASFIKPLAP